MGMVTVGKRWRTMGIRERRTAFLILVVTGKRNTGELRDDHARSRLRLCPKGILVPTLEVMLGYNPGILLSREIRTNYSMS